MEWRCGSYAFDPRMPIVMGVLNVTPDSFSDGGAHADLDSALAHARALIDDGAQIIDVGGESTRPGAAEVSCEEECARVVDVVRRLADQGICVSIDTRHAPVAQACVDAGASIINDVSGFSDPAMVRVAADVDLNVSIEDRKKFLLEHNIAVYDSIYQCDIIGSSDSSIKNVVGPYVSLWRICRR